MYQNEKSTRGNEKPTGVIVFTQYIICRFATFFSSGIRWEMKSADEILANCPDKSFFVFVDEYDSEQKKKLLRTVIYKPIAKLPWTFFNVYNKPSLRMIKYCLDPPAS